MPITVTLGFFALAPATAWAYATLRISVGPVTPETAPLIGERHRRRLGGAVEHRDDGGGECRGEDRDQYGGQAPRCRPESTGKAGQCDLQLRDGGDGDGASSGFPRRYKIISRCRLSERIRSIADVDQSSGVVTAGSTAFAAGFGKACCDERHIPHRDVNPGGSGGYPGRDE
ncbi:hypothetical protein [Plantactinospora veratri]